MREGKRGGERGKSKISNHLHNPLPRDYRRKLMRGSEVPQVSPPHTHQKRK